MSCRSKPAGIGSARLALGGALDEFGVQLGRKGVVAHAVGARVLALGQHKVKQLEPALGASHLRASAAGCSQGEKQTWLAVFKCRHHARSLPITQTFTITHHQQPALHAWPCAGHLAAVPDGHRYTARANAELWTSALQACSVGARQSTHVQVCSWCNWPAA